MRIKEAIFILVSLAVAYDCSSQVKDGRASFQLQDFLNNRTVVLNGEWLFAWKKLLSPAECDSTAALSAIQVPGNWFSLNPDEAFHRRAYGYGTYVVRLHLPANQEGFALKIPNIQTAYRLYVDGELKVQRGQPGTSEDSSIPNARTAILYLPADQAAVRTLVIQTSNYHFSSSSGIWSPIELGSFQTIIDAKTRNYLVSSVLVGSLIIMGLYHIALFLCGEKTFQRSTFP